MNHRGVVKLIDYGDSGTYIKVSGSKQTNIIYIIMEYLETCLFDLCENTGELGEDIGRIFAK